MKTISLSNEQAKRWGKLKQKKYRQRERQFLVEGLRLVEAAIETGQSIAAMVMTASFAQSGKAVKGIESLGCPIYQAEEKQWKQLSDTVHGQGILAIVAIPEPVEDPEAWCDRILILDRIQDPGNLGTILRTAEAFGFHDVLLAKGCADCYDGKVLRSSMGGVFTLNLVEWDSDSLTEIQDMGYRCMASALRDSQELATAEVSKRAALIIGNEANGIREAWLEDSDLRVSIPMTGDVESLNAGIAAGILMYAVQEKQRIELS